MTNFYTFGALLTLLLWAIFFLLQDRKQRVRMLQYSLLLSALGPFSQIWFLRDYWSINQFQLTLLSRLMTDLVFAFSLAGLGAVVLDTISKKRWESSTNLKLIPIILFPYIFFGIWMFIFTSLFKVNSIYSSSAYLTLIGVVLVYKKNTWPWTLLNGAIAAILSFILYLIFQQMFPGFIQSLNILIENNFYLLGIPITEMVFYFSAGIATYAGFKYVFSKN